MTIFLAGLLNVSTRTHGLIFFTDFAINSDGGVSGFFHEAAVDDIYCFMVIHALVAIQIILCAQAPLGIVLWREKSLPYCQESSARLC